MEEDINIFQRRLLRKILKIKWSSVISNEELYSRTDVTNWSEIIKQRRLRWLGHLLRLPVDSQAREDSWRIMVVYLLLKTAIEWMSQARLALNEFNIKYKRKRGRSKLTWVELVNNDLNIINKNFSLAGLSTDNLKRCPSHLNRLCFIISDQFASLVLH